MTLMGSIHRMPDERSPTRRWASTSTPQAEKEIAAGIEGVLKAHDALDKAREARDEILRKHYVAGVDVRDLVKIARENGWPTAAPPYIHRLVQAE